MVNSRQSTRRVRALTGRLVEPQRRLWRCPQVGCDERRRPRPPGGHAVRIARPAARAANAIASL